MIKKQYNRLMDYIEYRRFSLLLLTTVLVLVLPAYSGGGTLSNILYMLTMSFLFIQSMVAANVKKSRKLLINSIVITLIVITWLKPLGLDNIRIELFKIVSFVIFFLFVVIYLVRFIGTSPSVNLNVLITSVNIYLLIGIIGAFLATFLYKIFPDAYSFPAHITDPVFVNFLYYSFITMSTVGYGDITPKIPETQTLAYFISVTGQLYVAIIIAFLVGKLLVSAEKK